ncbi:hypothetical protein [Nonlabens sp.]|uniref:hypothetical protein n=1 Tax=Nonlabens sp. TaxID=1888209 RepID=UPI003267B233
MTKEQLLKLYADFSDRELINILTRDKEKYTQVAWNAAQSTLEKRSLDENQWNEIKEYDHAAKHKSVDEKSSLLDELYADEQARLREESTFEQQKKHSLETSRKQLHLNDEDLLNQFTSIIDIFLKNKEDHHNTDQFSKEEFLGLFAGIHDRNLQIPHSYKVKVIEVLDSILKKMKSKRNIMILLGLLLAFIGISTTLATNISLIFYGAIIVGCGMIVKAIANYSMGRDSIKKLKLYTEK